MKVAFLNRDDPRSRISWSGIPFFMHQALKPYCDEVISLGPAAEGWWFLSKAVRQFIRLIFRKNIDYSHTVALSRIMGRTFRQKLEEHPEIDLVFAPVASTEVAFLETALPIVIYADLTGPLFKDYAANVANLSDWSLAQIEAVEGRALRRADHLVYASEWAAQSAIRDCHIPPERISVVPMAANLDAPPTLEQVNAVRNRPFGNECKLIFIGVDWERKGGDTALAAMRLLRDRGINATLTVVGCNPAAAATEPNLRVVPFLNKTLPKDQELLIQLLLDADFMLFPTRREAFGVVCCEANACGLPLIASNVGGVPVRDGENGVLLQANATGEDYANTVHALLKDRERYLQLAHGGRAAFESRYNWDAWGRSMAEIFRRVLAEKVKVY